MAMRPPLRSWWWCWDPSRETTKAAGLVVKSLLAMGLVEDALGFYVGWPAAGYTAAGAL